MRIWEYERDIEIIAGLALIVTAIGSLIYSLSANKSDFDYVYIVFAGLGVALLTRSKVRISPLGK
jgi:threonine/homoserine efflux transporter RhtA